MNNIINIKNTFYSLIIFSFISCGNDAPVVINSQGNDMPTLADDSFVTIDGYNLPKELEFEGSVRYLVGGASRETFFVRPYLFGLYMVEKSTDPDVIVNADKPMSFRLHMTSKLLTNALMEEKVREGFDRSLDGKTEDMKPMIDLICGVFSSEPTEVGDVYDMHYTPGVGVSCAKNGVYFDYAKFTDTEQVKAGGAESFAKVMETIKYTESGISAISGLKFKKALYGLWFSDDPIDGALKDKVLGL